MRELEKRISQLKGELAYYKLVARLMAIILTLLLLI